MKKLALVTTLGLFLAAFATYSIDDYAGTAAATTRALEEQHILSSTVRFIVESWVLQPDEKGYDVDHAVGHGTVVSGRYLVTHNHFGVPIRLLDRPVDRDSSTALYLYNSRGELLHRGHFADFHLAYRDVETLVLGHKDEDFFTQLGVSSAPISTWTRLALEPGIEVAQVDWDGVVARVDWVRVEGTYLQGIAPWLVMDDGVLPGASGGGIFYGGVHIANNWRLKESYDGSGALLTTVTEAALNSDEVADLQQFGVE